MSGSELVKKSSVGGTFAAAVAAAFGFLLLSPLTSLVPLVVRGRLPLAELLGLLGAAAPATLVLALPIACAVTGGVAGKARLPRLLTLALGATLTALAVDELWVPGANHDLSERFSRLSGVSLPASALSPSEMSGVALMRMFANGPLPPPYIYAMHLKLALPFACIALAVLAAGIAHVARPGRLGAGAIGFGLGYVFTLSMEAGGAAVAVVPPLLAAWAPNLFMAALGVLLLRRREPKRDEANSPE